MDEEEYDAIFSFLEYGTELPLCMASQGPKASSSVCMDYAVDSGVYCTAKRIKKEGKLNIFKFLEAWKK